jgi:acid phosphatase
MKFRPAVAVLGAAVLLAIASSLAIGGRLVQLAGEAVGQGQARQTPVSTRTPAPRSTVGPSQEPSPTPLPPPAETLPDFSHVFIIVMENHEYGRIIGNPSAPYLNSLAQTYGLATNYYAITHPSLPNYLAMVAGSTFGIASDCTQCFVTAPTIADQIERSGRSWKAYLEGMPSPCYLGSSSGKYAQKHNPFVYFDGLRNDRSRCAAHVVPFSQFSDDLGGSVPDYVWITPDMCNDMHDCSVSTGDAWLHSVVPSILNSSAYRSGGAVFITFDEGSTGAGCCGVAAGGQVATLVISPMAKDAFQSTVAQTHYSLLRTIEDSWHLGHLGGAAAAGNLREYFRPPVTFSNRPL